MFKQGKKRCAYHVDHLIPRAFGGADHPLNYVMMPGNMNIEFSLWIDERKAAYVGRHAWSTSKKFHNWWIDQLRANSEKNIEWDRFMTEIVLKRHY